MTEKEEEKVLTREERKARKLAEKQAEKAAKEQRKLQNNLASKGNGKNENKIKKHIDADYEALTPVGEKKDITIDLPASYSPKFVEKCWNDWWIKCGFFSPDYDLEFKNPNNKFSMIFPPPNVTGKLHLGHALTSSIQDSLVRYHRMCGKDVEFIPGTDHAGIATQVVVEKRIKRLENKTRYDFTREKFIEKVWEWKHEYGESINCQLKSLGCSFDWDKAYFTLNDDISKAVNYTFINLFERGLIYRSKRLVNWSCTLSSAISNIEVDNVHIEGSTFLSVPGYERKIEFGVMHEFSYPLSSDPSIKLTVATTRIETMLGDVAIAVNPKDDRYTTLIGQTVDHPFCDRKLKIISDDYVDKDFGTGAVKITPAHDYNDFELGKRHNLEMINIFDNFGSILKDFNEFSGLKRFDARDLVISKLKELGLYVKKINHNYEIPICSRSKDIIEPLLKNQWFLNCSNVAKKSIDLVKNEEMKIYPENYKKIWFHWLENIEDWCISRQLWWGHQIPAYRVKNKASTLSDDENWIAASSSDEAVQKIIDKFGYEKNTFTVERDEDVLDTWFSAGLLPFACLGWPDKKIDEGTMKFFPNSLLETGSDILFFWVARMVFFSLFMFDSKPFDSVYLHSIVRDAFGRKMSKSLGNVIDPFMVINGANHDDLYKMLSGSNLDSKEILKAAAGQKKTYPEGIPACGSDALRFALCNFNISPKDINMDVLQIQAKRAFCNKIWNAFKLVQMKLGSDFSPESEYPIREKYIPINQWIFSCLKVCIDSCHEGFNQFLFTKLTNSLYEFFINQFCDVYLECIKAIIDSNDENVKSETKNTIFHCFRTFLILLHPLMPFITEELFQRLPRIQSIDENKYSICITKYPFPDQFKQFDSLEIIENFSIAQLIIKDIRSIRGSLNLTKQRIDCIIESNSQIESSKSLSSINLFLNDISVLTHTDFKFVCSNDEIFTNEKFITKSLNDIKFHVKLPSTLNSDELLKNFQLKISKLEKQEKQLEETFNSQILKNLSEETRSKNKLKLEKTKADLKSLTELMASLS